MRTGKWMERKIGCPFNCGLLRFGDEKGIVTEIY